MYARVCVCVCVYVYTYIIPVLKKGLTVTLI